jgi:molybdopterin guanine dinucleotide-containing S/N-oxide reductase-like protein
MLKRWLTKLPLVFDLLMFGLHKHLVITAWRYEKFAKRMAERNLIVQFLIQQEGSGYWFEFKNGKVRYRKGLHPQPGMTLGFRDRRTALEVLIPPTNWGEQIHAQKNFRLFMDGHCEDTAWFFPLLIYSMSIGEKYGEALPSGETRFVTGSNGGPMYVDVRDGKIVRMTPIVLKKDDAASWTIKARGRSFTPPRRAALSPHALCMRSRVYSKDRILYPMRRIDFDPNGERNCEKRGISGYERISWDQALDIVVSEIKRVKKDRGPGAIGTLISAHHLWGNVGYHLSTAHRFWNLIGHTYIEHNPESWEGWFWGAMHHWGHSTRCGTGDPYGLVEDCLKHTDLIVFWSSDPESTHGVYSGQEASIRRQWAKELGIEFVHIDPFFNHTAAALGGKWLAPRPGTSNALALAIAYVWIDESLYDKKYVDTLTIGFDEWKAHIMGEDGTQPKTPEWAEVECGIEAHVIRALARKWGKTKTYLSAGGWGNGVGSANRQSTGVQWARSMVCLGAMQGMGKPGSNMGNLQFGTPLDYTFYFPGYVEGGISGDFDYTATIINNYQRMPHLATKNGVRQRIPRLKFVDAILDGKAEGNIMIVDSVAGQFDKWVYPAPGHAPVEFLYRYGGSYTSTLGDSNRYIKTLRSPKLSFIVNQSIWQNSEANFADIILPACTNLERWDIGEWANAGGIAHHFQAQLNHRIVHMQHKCIEPLGESKSDYQIFFELAKRLGLSDYFSEGMTEYDWVKRVFESSDVAKVTSWKHFLKKGYYVVPPDAEAARTPVSMNWFAEGRKKDVPDGTPVASEYSGEWLKGLQTQSGKFEFVPQTLRRSAREETDRPAVNTYARGWEGYFDEERTKQFPLQMIAPHPRYSFHTMGDGTDSFLSEIEDHRLRLKGDDWPYNKARMNPADAAARNIKDRDLVRIFNDRGGIVCAAQVTERIRPGAIHVYESSSLYKAAGEPGKSVDLGGGANQLSPSRMLIKNSHAQAGNSILVQMEVWHGEVNYS